MTSTKWIERRIMIRGLYLKTDPINNKQAPEQYNKQPTNILKEKGVKESYPFASIKLWSTFRFVNNRACKEGKHYYARWKDCKVCHWLRGNSSLWYYFPASGADWSAHLW